MNVRKDVVLHGQLSGCKFGAAQSLITFVPAIEIIDYFSVFKTPIELEAAFVSITNTTNERRISRICDDIEAGLNTDTPCPHLAATFAISGKPELKKGNINSLASIRYQPEDCLLVDGVLTVYAVLQSLGFTSPYTSKRTTRKKILESSSNRQQVASLPIAITLLFNEETGLSQGQLLSMFNQYNSLEDHLYYRLSERLEQASPTISFVHELANELELDKFGGMAVNTNRVSKTDAYVTTESTMVRFILGVIGGGFVQDVKNPPQHLSDGTVVDAKYYQTLKPFVLAFMKSWLTTLAPQFKANRDGFHYSTQTWQALGLTLHQLLQTKPSKKQLSQAGKVLGKLNYARDASHWHHCAAMKLDAKGKYFKNATNGGRSFREGLANYLLTQVSKVQIQE